jgi:hypothetical protein
MCENCIDSEKELIKLFKLNFIHRNDIGNEYFEGNSYKIVIYKKRVTSNIRNIVLNHLNV